MKKVLVIDDDITFSLTLQAFLQRNGFDVQLAHNARKGTEMITTGKFDVILTDFRLPDNDGTELLKIIREKSPRSLAILMTAYADIRMAVNAIKFGAYEYVSKPVIPDELLGHINNGLEKQEKSTKPPSGKQTFGSLWHQKDYLEGVSQSSRTIHEHINLVAGTSLSVIIQGESGTGKEYIARKIHENSDRCNKPFVAVDCGALSRELAGSEFFGHLKGSFTGAIQDKTGQFEAAHQGTIFLDEIGNLSYDVQVKLLRAIQERQIRKIGSNKDIPVDVRILAATNEDLQEQVKDGAFREDLFHRLNEFSIKVPPLRERKEDIPLFVNHFLRMANTELNRSVENIPGQLMDIFRNYPWPGNIREIRNVIKRAVLLTKGGELDLKALPAEVIQNSVAENISENNSSEKFLKSQAEKTERDIIIATLEKVRYNKTKAAKLLDIDRRTLYNKLKAYGIPLD